MVKRAQKASERPDLDGDWLTVEQAAAMLPCSQRHLWTLIREDAREGLDKETRHEGRRRRVYLAREWLSRISSELASGLRRSRAHGSPRSREVHETIEVRCNSCKMRLPVETAGVERDKRENRHYVLLFVNTQTSLQPSPTDDSLFVQVAHSCSNKSALKGDDG
jgi:hypothetical protein